MLHELMLHFFPLFLRNHSRKRKLIAPCPKKDFQVANGLITGIEGKAMTLRKLKLYCLESGR